MRTWSLSLALLLLLACRNTPVEVSGEPRIVSPRSKIHGKSYAEWSAEWWKFVFSTPASANPLLHDDKCEQRQSGPVWFLTGKWAESPVIASRHCSIPQGKYLFFPVVTTAGDNIGEAVAKSVEELRAEARGIVDANADAKCWLDGREVPDLIPATSPYRVASPVFSYSAPPGGLQGAPAGMLIGPVVSDGVFLMLEPLAAGRHTIRFSSSSLATSYSFDITYVIDIAPAKR